MSIPLSAIVQELIAAGVTGDALVTAIKRLEAAETPAKSKGAERTARWRERKTERHGDVTPSQAVTSDDKKSFDKESFQTFKEITSKKLNTTRAKPVALPDDWEPNAKTWRLSEDLGFEPREVFDQIERMRDWAVNAPSSKSNKSDWDATFRNWLKRVDDDRQKRKSGSIPKPNTFADGFDKIDAALGELERRERKTGEDSGFLDLEAVPGLRQSAA